MKLRQPFQIDRADHIHVVQNKRFVCTRRILKKNPRSFFQSPTSTQQLVLARYFNAHPEVFILLQILDHHVGEVMSIHNHFPYSKLTQPRQRYLQQRSPTHLYQRLGTIIRKRPQTRPQPRRKDHRLHRDAVPGAGADGCVIPNRAQNPVRNLLFGVPRSAYLLFTRHCHSPTLYAATPHPLHSSHATASPTALPSTPTDAVRPCIRTTPSSF